MIFAGVVHQRKEGRADWPSLFVFSAALCLLAGALLAGNAYRWVAIALLLAAFCSASRRPLPVNALAASLCLYCAWLFVNAAFVTPAYSAEDLYRPVVLLGGFCAAAALDRDGQLRLFRAGVALLALLVLIGLLQFFFGFWHLAHNPQRAAATFITPNSFATAINMFLLPLAALVLSGRGGRPAYALALWLFAGLLSTESRGGWLACVAALGFISIYQGKERMREMRRAWVSLLAGMVAVFAVFTAATRIAPPAGLDAAFGETIVARGTAYRVDIGMVTLGQIAEKPFTGAGANMFRPLFEMNKPATLDIGATFPFAHNDYLQIWLEFGLPGLALLSAVIGAALILLRKARRLGGADDPLPLASGAAVASCFVHALVDFPLYVPFLLTVLGLWLGALAALLGDSDKLNPMVSQLGDRLKPLRSPVIGWVLSVALLAWLAQPALADYAGRRALTELGAGRAEPGLYWQSVARRLEPRNAAQYWAEGIIWRDLAVEAADKTLATKADRLFVEGIGADPYQVANYLERARFHRTHPELFDPRLPAAEVVSWTLEALRRRPYSLQVQAEHARTLHYAGRVEEARGIALAMLARHPSLDLAQRLVKELSAPGG